MTHLDGHDHHVVVSQRYGYADREGTQADGGELWRSRHSPDVDERTEADELSRCLCPGGRPPRCQCKASSYPDGADHLCVECARWCWAIGPDGQGVRLLELYGAPQ
jgi:hypothetical protein